MTKRPLLVHLMNALTSEKHRLADNEEVEQYAALAYSLCTKWFGLPSDAKWPTYFIATPTSSFCIRYRTGYYMIGLAEDTTMPEDRYLLAGHEMYHRVTCTMPGIREFIWVDEMMAALASARVMTEYGMEAYADKYISKVVGLPMQFQFDDLKNVRLNKKWLLNSRKPYPVDFSNATLRLGEALLSLVSWETLCTLVHAHSLEQWMCSVGEQEKPFLVPLFSPDPIGSLSRLHSSNADGYINLAFALNTLGNKDAAIAALRHSISVNPHIASAHRFLGVLLDKRKLYDEAISHWLKAVELDHSDADTYYYLGRAYYNTNQHNKARYFLQTAATLSNCNQKVHHYLELLK